MRMPLYVYAIVDRETAMVVDDLPGLTRSARARETPALPALSIVRAPSCALVTEIIDRLPEPIASSLAAQDVIVRRLAARAEALLPLRFGTSFEDDAALLTSLEQLDIVRVRAALDRVRGREQMILRAFGRSAGADMAPAAPAAVSSGPGTAYLMQRVAALKSAPASRLAALRQQLASIVRDEIVEDASSPRQQPPLLESAYHLIARGDAERYQAIVTAWPAPADIAIRVSGPSPAYAFAKDALS